MHHAVDIAIKTDEQAEFRGVLDFAFNNRALGMGCGKAFPGIALNLLETQRNPALGSVDFQNLHFHLL